MLILSQFFNFSQTLFKLDASFDREISVDADVTSVTPLIFSNMGGGLLTITGSGLYSSRYSQTEVNVCSSILSHTGTEIICETRPSKGEGSINIDIKYYINKGTGNMILIGPDGNPVDQSNYRVDTGATFFYENADVTVISNRLNFSF